MMNFFRSLIVILAFLALTSCEDKQSKTITDEVKIERDSSKIDNITINGEVEKIEKSDSQTSEEQEFPVLNDKSAMDFFLKYQEENKENKVRLTTDFGTIDILLYPETKFHRANFIYLTKRGYFDDTQFYRVVKNFIIQGGNTDDPEVKSKRGDIGRYLLPKDTRHGFKHHRGVVSMPSSEIANPHKLASPYEFFIVQKPGGSYHLDGDYTAFGRVIDGMDVVDEIASKETDRAEWPLHNIYIRKAEIIE